VADAGESSSSSQTEGQSGWKTVGAVILLIVIIGGAVVVFDRWIMPPHPPAFQDPSAWDVLVGSRLVVGLIRLLAIILALYVVLSVVALVRDKRWLVGFGGTRTEGLDRRKLQQQLREADSKLASLASEYEQVVRLLMQAVGDVPDFPGLDTEGGGHV